MKYQGNNIFALLFVVTLWISPSWSVPEWCWTRPEPEAKISKNAIGINWAACEGQPIDLEKLARGEFPPEKSSDEGNFVQLEGGNCDATGLKTKYEIKINMGQDEQFVGQSGPYYMTINSDSTQGEEFTFITKPFINGQQEKVVREVTNVGQLSSITLRQADQDDGPFACKSIVINEGASEWEFPCNAVLDKNQKTMTVDLKQKDDVTIVIKQKEEQKSSGPFPLAMRMQGNKGVTHFFLVDDFVIDGRQKEIDFQADELGDLESINLKSFFSKGKSKECNIESVKITVKNDYGSQDFEFVNNNNLIISKSKPGIQLMRGGNKPNSNQVRKLPPCNRVGSLDNDSVPGEPMSSEPVTNFQNGLTPDEEKYLQYVDCETKGNIVLQDYIPISDVINYEVKYVVCPPKCNENASLIGRGIYHPDSTVCSAGIVDGSIPKIGGLMGVVRLTGQKSYDQRPQSYGMTITQGNESRWSFTTVKINNPDFSKSDLRIINDTGVPDFQGRVEFRVGGHWGTVAHEGTNNNFARMVCRVLNYKDGDVLNNKRNYCAEHRGKDYCGAKGQPVHYSHYSCAETDTQITQCLRQVPGNYDHEDDVIVRCSNIDKKNQEDVGPQEGTVRLMGINSPSTNNRGRVEIFRDQKWGAICNTGFTNESADVSCKQMGFNEGRLLTGVQSEYSACKFGDDNYCVASSEQIILTNVQCKGEKKLGECGGQATQDCAVEMTAVIECSGEKGDTTGTSQQEKQEDDITPPLLGQLPLANPYILGCDTELTEKEFDGDPGSIYVVKCPEGCREFSKVIHGSGIYTYDSPICKAAIHNGVIDNRGGFATIKIGWPHKQFKPSNANGIISVKHGWSPKSFFPVILFKAVKNHQFPFQFIQIKL